MLAMASLRTIRGTELGYDFDIQTNMHNYEAIQVLALIGTDFAQSLYLASQERKLSTKQLFWVHVLVLEAQGVKVR